MYINPYDNLTKGKWCKTNFHTHAGTGYKTCGANPIDQVVDLYRMAEYDMLCISNHNTFTDTSEFTDENMLMVPGVEYTQDRHMLTIGVDKSLHDEDYQTAINMTSEMNGFTILCHPNWPKKEHFSRESLDELSGYAGIEVINQLIYRLSGSGLATDTWDYLLSQGKLVYGFGNDDFHIPTDAARSFNLIYCEDLSCKSMKKAIDNGEICASTGLYPDYLKLENDVIQVKVKFPKETYIDMFTYRFISENGDVVSVQNGSVGEYKLNGEKYVRVEAFGENGAMIFFQPIYLSDIFSNK